jgi:hypothetical protein
MYSSPRIILGEAVTSLAWSQADQGRSNYQSEVRFAEFTQCSIGRAGRINPA